MPDEAAECRARAEECLREAERARTPDEKATWLQLHKEYLALAQSIEEHWEWRRRLSAEMPN